MAFRWQSAVRRIHRVVDADVVPTLQHRFPDMPVTEDSAVPHAVYRLGPQLPPLEPVPSGTTYRAGRMWVLLDQLQTAPTLKDALAGTRALEADG